jgi:hypothetical protein
VPSAYIVPNTPGLAPLIAKLRLHGVVLTPARGSYTVEKFAIDSMRVASRENEGHRERTVFGSWVPGGAVTPGPDAYVVSMKQPLARLIFTLLEPRSDDGLIDWGFADAALEGKKEAPIFRVR